MHMTQLEDSGYVIWISVDTVGNVHVNIDEPRQPHGWPKIRYTPMSTESQPTIILEDKTVPLDDIDGALAEIGIAQDVAKRLVKYVHKHFRLSDTEPGGSIENRSKAIWNLIRDHEEKGLPSPTMAEIDEAIATCYQTDKRTWTRIQLDAVYNMLSIENDDRIDQIDNVTKLAKDYIKKRERHIKLSQAPAKEYDHVATKNADMVRAIAHNAFITAMTGIANIAHEYKMESAIASIATQKDPYQNREFFAKMAYEIV